MLVILGNLHRTSFDDLILWHVKKSLRAFSPCNNWKCDNLRALCRTTSRSRWSTTSRTTTCITLCITTASKQVLSFVPNGCCSCRILPFLTHNCGGCLLKIDCLYTAFRETRRGGPFFCAYVWRRTRTATRTPTRGTAPRQRTEASPTGRRPR